MRAESAIEKGSFAALTLKSKIKRTKAVHPGRQMPGIPMVTRVGAANVSIGRATVHLVGGLGAIEKNIQR